MKLTKEKLYELIEEVISMGGSRKRKKGSASSPTDMGSKEKPCPPGSFGPGIGNKMFDPQIPGATEWECSTEVEDKMLLVLQRFITYNKWTDGAENLAPQMLRYLLNQGDENTPIRRYPDGKPVYRGAGLSFKERPEQAMKIINSINWNEPEGKYSEKGMDFILFKLNDYSLKPHRAYTSFSPKLEAAAEFAVKAPAGGKGGARVIYVTNSSEAPDGNYFLEFNDLFYKMVTNPHYKNKTKLGDFQTVAWANKETEALYLGNGALPIQAIMINIVTLLKAFRHYAVKNKLDDQYHSLLEIAAKLTEKRLPRPIRRTGKKSPIK